MTVTIELVRNRGQLAEFIALPRRLYLGMPGYVPPLDIERRELLDPKKSPFFSHGYAAYWIARRDGRVVGRVSAQIDQMAGPSAPPDLGLFGCLDTIDDREVVVDLLHTAEDWLRRHNRRHIRGPFLLSINGETGLLIEGQLESPITLLPWHPTYLNQYLLEAGYVCSMRMFSYVLDLKNLSAERLHELETARQGNKFSVKSMDLDNFKTEMEIGRKLFNDGWQNNWGFTPGSVTDTRGLARAFKPFLLRGAGFFINVGDEPAGFALSIPNIFDISADIGPTPSLLGWLRLAIRIWRQRYRSFRLVFIGASLRHHGTGIGKIMLSETIRRLLQYKAEKIACAWVLENNAALIRILTMLEFQRTATYGVFEKHC